MAASPIAESTAFRYSQLLPQRKFEIGRFYSIGTQYGAKGVHHTVFWLHDPAMYKQLSVSEYNNISGNCFYAYIRSNSTTVGIVFITPTQHTEVSDFTLLVNSIGVCTEYRPIYTLEPIGLLMTLGAGGTLLIIPTKVDSSLLVKID